MSQPPKVSHHTGQTSTFPPKQSTAHAPVILGKQPALDRGHSQEPLGYATARSKTYDIERDVVKEEETVRRGTGSA